MIFRTFIIVIVVGFACFTLLFFTSCQSHEQAADDAFELVKEGKQSSLNDTESVEDVNYEDSVEIQDETTKPLIAVSEKSTVVKKIETKDEWEIFKVEIEKKITLNEAKIKTAKSASHSNSKTLKKIQVLEMENNDLRRKMNEYNEEVKIKWETFKAELNQKASNIELEIKDVVISKK